MNQKTMQVPSSTVSTRPILIRRAKIRADTEIESTIIVEKREYN